MSQPAPYHSYTYHEYLALEESSNVKHEFFNGEIYAMAGGTPEHAAIAMAIGAALLTHLRGSACRVYGSDLRIRVLATGLTTYPDVSVVCGELQRDAERPPTVTNPKVLIEVLSDSTAAYDRGEKLEQYKRIESVQAVLLFSQSSRRVELHERSGLRWHTEVFTADQSVPIPSIGAELSLASIYADAGL
ncbi:MAG: Uma2 family endonuclease [Polyangiaceae bacterium]